MVDRFGRETRTYEIVYSTCDEKHEELEALFNECRTRIRNHKRMKRNGDMVSVWELEGRVSDHLCLAEKLLADRDQGIEVLGKQKADPASDFFSYPCH
jgi:hypothetical protein